MRTDVDTALSAIEAALSDRSDGCQHCAQPLGNSPSADFCGEDCQHAWQVAQADTGLSETGTTPDESMPETMPVRPLHWLGPPPPGTIVRAGHEVLDAVRDFLARFSAFPHEHCAPTLALWYAHTHAVDQFYVTPRLILDSAEPGSGKTRVLEVAQHLVAVPEMTISATTAALFRLVSMGPITILFDEVDAIFNPKSGGNNEDLRGLLNSGYKRSATVARCVGDARNMKVQRFPVYAPAALVGIAGGMPATITTRAITIHMRRRRADEPVEPFRERQVAREAQPIRTELAAWIDSVRFKLGESMPQMPEGVTDRPAEIWEPLLAIADAAGGHWPETARAACRHFVLCSGAQITSLGVRLLADLKGVFARTDSERMRTTEILTALHELEESPWSDLNGRPLDARRLAKELDRYGVKPGAFKAAGETVKGYQTGGEHGLTDAWDRYLPERSPDIGNSGNSGNRAVQPVTGPHPVTDPSVTPSLNGYRSIGNATSSGNPVTSTVTGVTAVTAPTGPSQGEPRP